MKNHFKASVVAILLFSGFTSSKTYAQTGSSSLEVVQNMLAAFGKGDMEALKKTVSNNSVWVYQGPETVPYTGTYNGKEGAVKFITNIVSNVQVLDFKINKIVSDNDTVVVIGYEKQKVNKTGKTLEQKWVQVYTVENGLITRMEEYTDTDNTAKFFKK